MLVLWDDFGCSWGLKADLDDSDDSGTVWSCLSGGFDPRYAESLGRFWMLLRVGSWCGRQFHVFKPFYVSILGGFGCSWRLKADLDDSFTFWSRFMLVFWDDFGCSWGLKADLDDSFTFLSCFKDGLDPRTRPGKFRLLIFGGHFGDQKWSKDGPTNYIFCTNFRTSFWRFLGCILGTKTSPKWANMASKSHGKEPWWRKETILKIAVLYCFL